MAEFGLLGHIKRTVRVKRNQVFFQVVFRLPDEFKELHPMSETEQIEGDLMMGFYCDPAPGDRITYNGFEWEVLRRDHWPTKRGSKQTKRVASVALKFIGSATVTT